MTKEIFDKIICLRSYGIVANDIKGEDKDINIAVEVKDIDKALFSL
jgi:hypothetical protein